MGVELLHRPSAISLSTRTTSSLIVKPQTPSASALQTWLTSNSNKITELLASKACLPLTSVENEHSDNITPIASLDSFPDHTISTLQCDLSIVDIYQSFWYMGCNSCHRSTSASYMERFTCNFCKKKDVQGLPRSRITVQALGSTGTITASIFGEDAEELISCDAVTLMKMENKEQVGSIIKTQSEGKLLLHVKANRSEYRGELKRRYNLSIIRAPPTLPSKPPVLNLEKRYLENEEACTSPRDKGKQKQIAYGTTNEGSL